MHDGEVSASVLIDLAKAYELVQPSQVWAAGIRAKFPPAILRLELEAFAMLRPLMDRGA